MYIVTITYKPYKEQGAANSPNNEEIPAKWSEKIAKSTDPPECDCTPAKGGYTVQPVPGPFSTKALNNNNNKEGGKSQNDTLFNLGNAISGAPQCIGKK